MDVMLSDKDVLKLMGKGSTFIPYHRLKDYHSINQLFGNKSKVLLLYVNKIEDGCMSGHWTVLLRPKSNIIEYYDSYGEKVDNPLHLYKKSWRQASDQDKKYLSDLLYDWMEDPNNEVHYNEYKMQGYRPGVNTCGRFVGIRSHFYKIPLKKYQKIFRDLHKKGYNLDKVITYLSDELNGRKIK